MSSYSKTAVAGQWNVIDEKKGSIYHKSGGSVIYTESATEPSALDSDTPTAYVSHMGNSFSFQVGDETESLYYCSVGEDAVITVTPSASATEETAIGDVISQSGSIKDTEVDPLECVTLYEMALPKGAWLVSGNVTCVDDAIVGGWAKAQIRESTDFSFGLECMIETTGENDFSISPMTRHVSTEDETTVYFTYMHEIRRTTASWYYRIEATRVG